MINIPILPLLILVPLIGVIFVLLSVEDDEYSFQSKKSALWTSIINFLLSLYLPFNFDKGVPHFQFVNSFSWLNNENLKFSLGVDGISLPFILLSTFLIPLCIFFIWNNKMLKIKSYLVAFLLLVVVLFGYGFCLFLHVTQLILQVLLSPT